MKKNGIVLIILIILIVFVQSGCRVRITDNSGTAVYEEAESENLEDEEEQTEQDEDASEEYDEDENSGYEEETAESESEHTNADEEAEEGITGGEGEAVAETAEAVSFVEIVPDETEITVTYDSNGGDTGSFISAVLPGDTYGSQPEAERRGYDFTGWYDEDGNRIYPETIVTRTEDHTLYARWEKAAAVSISFDGNGGRVKAAQSEIELAYGDAFGDMPIPLREGYDFLGWFTEPEGGEEITEETIFEGTEDLTLYAQWEYNPYEYWAFVLENRIQQMYMCQQASLYIELDDGTTEQYSYIITGSGSLNIAENLSGEYAEDSWVMGKNPELIIKVSSGTSYESVYEYMAERFPGYEIAVISDTVLSSSSSALYAELYIAKYLYEDWYTDIDLSQVSSELGVPADIILIYK